MLVTTYSYDADGELLSTQQSSGGVALRTASVAYTLTGNPAASTDPKGNVTRFAYDTVDRVSSVTDPVGNVTSVSYDALSRAVASYNLAIQSPPLVQQSYTPDGLTASQTVARSPTVADTTVYAYDGFDRLGTVTYPDASTEAYSYDADSNVLTRKTRKGDTFTFAYDTATQKVAALQLALPLASVRMAYMLNRAARRDSQWECNLWVKDQAIKLSQFSDLKRPRVYE